MKNIKKRLFSFVLALAMTITLVAPISVSAESYSGNIVYYSTGQWKQSYFVVYAVGDDLTNMRFPGAEFGEILYFDGTAYSDSCDSFGGVIVKIDGKKLYVCSDSDHESNKKENNLCPNCDPDEAKHTHNFTFSANGATLKAYCTESTEAASCQYQGSDNAVSLILSASSANYSGSPAIVTVTDTNDAWATAVGSVPEVRYYKNEDCTTKTSTDDGAEAAGGAPSKAGDYWGAITVGEGADAKTAKVSYTILPAPSDFNDLRTEISNNSTIRLEKDYLRGDEQSGIYIYDNKKVSIDLNGHTINGAKSNNQGYIFYVDPGCELIISDSSNGNGVIAGGTGYKYEGKAYGGAIFNQGTVTINGGTFTDNSGDYGGVVYNEGTVTINGGTFTDNSGNSGNYGGVVYNNGTVTINGGTFTGNSGSRGGAVYNSENLTITGGTFTGNSGSSGGTINNGGNLTITGGTFTGNSGSSGGVAYNSGNLTITGGTVTNNTATYGGAISNGGSLTVTGGTFTDNTANRDGGAIDNYNGSICIGGSVVIKDNKKGSATNNVELETGTTLTLTTFSTTAEVGLTINGAPDPLISEGVNLTVLSYIKSDNNAEMFVVNNGALKSETKASHVHSGGSATCQTQGTCQTCGQSYYGEHNYGYSATGNILKYACQTSGCTEGVALTLSANDANYSGNAVTANYGDGEAAAWEAKTGENAPTIKYVGRGTTEYTESDTAPTKVGKYTAKITVNDQTASVDFEIKQPEIDVTKSDVNSTGIIKESYTVGKAIQDITVDINFDINKIDSINNYQNSVVVKEGTKVLEYGEDKDYTVSEGSIKVTLTKSYLNSLSVGTHNITIEITDNNSQKLTYPITVTVASVPSSGGGSTTPTTTPSYKVPNTSVGQDINPMNKTIGLLSIALVAGCIARKKKED